MNNEKYKGRNILKGHKYPRVYWPNHPCAYESSGFAYVHRVVWYEHNGEIPDGYIIHHVDGDVENWNINNLELMKNEDHSFHHSGAEKEERRCGFCGKKVMITTKRRQKQDVVYCGNECAGKDRMDKNTKIDWPDIETLCEMVDTESFLHVAKKLGVSDTSIRRRLECRGIDPKKFT